MMLPEAEVRTWCCCCCCCCCCVSPLRRRRLCGQRLRAEKHCGTQPCTAANEEEEGKDEEEEEEGKEEEEEEEGKDEEEEGQTAAAANDYTLWVHKLGGAPAAAEKGR